MVFRWTQFPEGHRLVSRPPLFQRLLKFQQPRVVFVYHSVTLPRVYANKRSDGLGNRMYTRVQIEDLIRLVGLVDIREGLELRYVQCGGH